MERIQRLESQLTSASSSIIAQARSLPNPSAALAAQTMAAERSQASFATEDMTVLIDGGRERTALRREVQATIGEDVVLNNQTGRFDMTRDQKREKAMKRVVRLRELAPTDLDYRDTVYTVLALHDPGLATRIGVHYGLALGAIMGQGSDDLIDEIASDLMVMKAYGCFGMTEMGHGSNVQGLETTATFSVETDEFILHTPTLTATKWWIGGLAHTATHSVVFARLITHDGVDHGTHSFLVPLRERPSGDLCKGIRIGDCGKKMGMDAIDNGWMQFDHVRVPRGNMLSKWARVSREGIYTQPPRPQLAYGALVNARVNIVRSSSNVVKQALTIAIRYGVVRRQFTQPSETRSDRHETQILDYNTHQIRLFPMLAACYAYHFSATTLLKQCTELETRMRDKGDLTGLADMHAISAGLKAFSTWWAMSAIETCRQCLGGHGYSAYARLATMLGDFAVQQTWDGDNTVLALQTARHLIASVSAAKSGNPLAGFVDYLATTSDHTAHSVAVPSTVAQLISVDFLVDLFERRTAHGIRRVAASIAASSNAPTSSFQLVHISRIHCDLVVLRTFATALATDAAPHKCPSPVRTALTNLLRVFALHLIHTNLGDFLLVVKPESAASLPTLVEDALQQLFIDIRRDALAYVDAFDLADYLVSPFGRFDGNIYASYFEQVTDAPGATGKAPYWDSLIKPLLQQGEDDD